MLYTSILDDREKSAYVLVLLIMLLFFVFFFGRGYKQLITSSLPKFSCYSFSNCTRCTTGFYCSFYQIMYVMHSSYVSNGTFIERKDVESIV